MSVDKSKRNRNAGTQTRLSEKARQNKLKYDKAYNKKTKKERADRNRKRREGQKRGNSKASIGSGYDYDHGSKKFVKSSTNRGSTTGTTGDRNRGKNGGKKK